MGVTVYPEIGFFPGMVMPYAGPVAPDGWLLCDGSLQDRTTYASLYAIVGFSYSPTPGTDPGSNQFYLPNLKGKVIVMRDVTQTEFDVLGEAGGSKTSTAAHTHNLQNHTHNLGSHSHTYGHTHGMNTVDTNHAHGVYGANANVDSNGGHFHIAQFIRVVYDTANRTHAHAGGANTLSEGVSGGIYYGAWATIDVNGAGEHQHYTNHGHNTNLATEAGYGGQSHAHGTNSQSASTTSGPTGGSDVPSSNTSGASSAEATSGNLQPYLTMNYLIKI